MRRTALRSSVSRVPRSARRWPRSWSGPLRGAAGGVGDDEVVDGDVGGVGEADDGGY